MEWVYIVFAGIFAAGVALMVYERKHGPLGRGPQDPAAPHQSQDQRRDHPLGGADNADH